MAIIIDRTVLPLFIEAQRLVGTTQDDLARIAEVSRRTVSRWYGGGSTPSVSNVVKLAVAVHPHDRGLAAKLASHAGHTLQTLGLETSAVSRTAVDPAPAPSAHRPSPPVPLLVESIVCAAAEALETTPAAVRHVVRAAFARARGLGLSVEDVDAALAPRPEPAPTPTPTKAGGKAAKAAPSG